MRRLDTQLTVHAGFAWFMLVLFGVLFLAVMLWSMLDAPVHNTLQIGASMTDSARADKTVRRTRLFWEYWPLWGAGLAALLIGYRRAVSETGRRV